MTLWRGPPLFPQRRQQQQSGIQQGGKGGQGNSGGGVRQWRTRLGHEVLPTLRRPKQGRSPKGRKEEEGLFGGEEAQPKKRKGAAREALMIGIGNRARVSSWEGRGKEIG